MYAMFVSNTLEPITFDNQIAYAIMIVSSKITIERNLDMKLGFQKM